MQTREISHFADDKLIFDHAVVKEPDNKCYPEHIHERIEILYLVRGNAVYAVGNEKYAMTGNIIYIVAPGVKHRVSFDGCSLYERYDILPDQGILPKSAIQRILDGRDFAAINVTKALSDLCERMDEYYKSLGGEQLKQMYYAMMNELALNLIFETECPSTDYDTSQNALVADALKYIDEHIKDVSDISQVCKSLFVSRSYFYHIFMQTVNVSPKEYIRYKRLSLARDLIRRGKKPTEVYSSVGFCDYTTFFRAYKTRFGYPPSKEKNADTYTTELLT